MGDQLTDLLRERFTGHEMNVPPGAWEHVSGQLAANASGESLRESLQDKFQGHEVKVDPSAWANISGQLGQGAAAGSSFSAGWIAAGVAAVAVTATVLLWTSGNAVQKAVVTEKPAVVVAEAPAPVTAPAATFPAPEDIEPAHTDLADHSTSVKIVTPAIRQDEQQPVTSASLPETKPEAETPQAQVPASAAAQAPEHKPVAVQPKSSTPEKEATETRSEPALNTGTDTPEALPEADPSGTTSAADDPGTDEPEEDPFPTAATTNIFIPNVFSPQGDGVNDKLEIVAKDYEKVDVRVFAAKGGALVFRSNDLSNMWDGRLSNGNYAEEGYYKCVVLLTDTNGRPRVKSEVVRLFR